MSLNLRRGSVCMTKANISVQQRQPTACLLWKRQCFVAWRVALPVLERRKHFDLEVFLGKQSKAAPESPVRATSLPKCHIARSGPSSWRDVPESGGYPSAADHISLLCLQAHSVTPRNFCYFCCSMILMSPHGAHKGAFSKWSMPWKQ